MMILGRATEHFFPITLSSEWILPAALPRELLRSLKEEVGCGDRVEDASLLIAPACSL